MLHVLHVIHNVKEQLVSTLKWLYYTVYQLQKIALIWKLRK